MGRYPVNITHIKRYRTKYPVRCPYDENKSKALWIIKTTSITTIAYRIRIRFPFIRNQILMMCLGLNELYRTEECGSTPCSPRRVGGANAILAITVTFFIRNHGYISEAGKSKIRNPKSKIGRLLRRCAPAPERSQSSIKEYSNSSRTARRTLRTCCSSYGALA